MSFNPTSPLSGPNVGALTTPTYTLTADVGPNAHSEQYAVTALGGTQTDVRSHSSTDPFTITVERPASFRQLGAVNPSSGQVQNVPNNVYIIRVRKGVIPLSGQSKRIAMCELRISVPAGSDVADVPNLSAMVSAFAGVLSDQADGIGDLLTTGIL